MSVSLNPDNSVTFAYRIPADNRVRFIDAFVGANQAEYDIFRNGQPDTSARRGLFADAEIKRIVRGYVRSHYRSAAAIAAAEAEAGVTVDDP